MDSQAGPSHGHGSNHPLRPYAPADMSWIPAPSGNTTRSAASPSSNGPQQRVPLSSVPARNRYDASIPPELAGDAISPNAGIMLRAFLTSSVLSFTSTAIAMPFEVGKTLCQVQWVPKMGIDIAAPTEFDDEDGLDEEAIELETEEDAEAYFADVREKTSTHVQPAPTEARPVSPSGYLKRTSVLDERYGTKPEWTMPVVIQGGVWEMIKAIGRWRGEGWPSLWKGQLTMWFQETLSSTLQPLFFTALTTAFLPSSAFISLSNLPLMHSPRPGPALVLATVSHALSTVLLSPLDLVRTRLIVQSAQPQHRKYSGPVDALRTISKEEGGLWTSYFHANLFAPALLEGILKPLITLSTPLLISRTLHIEPSTSPLSFALCQFVFSSAGLLITVPLETVRKRLQLQTRAVYVRNGRPGGTGRPWRTCVETRPVPYAGIVEAVYRILTEETGNIPRRRRKSASRPQTPAAEEERPDLTTIGLGSGSGIRQLYRGLGMGLAANSLVFLLGLVSGGGDNAGWAEM